MPDIPRFNLIKVNISQKEINNFVYPELHIYVECGMREYLIFFLKAVLRKVLLSGYDYRLNERVLFAQFHL